MKVELDLNRIQDGILVINLPDSKSNNQSISEPSKLAAEPKDKTTSLPDFFSPYQLTKAIRALKYKTDNSFLTRTLRIRGYIKQIEGSRLYTTGPKWTDDMGKIRTIHCSGKNINGKKYVKLYNKNHPVIREIIKNALA